jgi:hypothetical protein
LKDSRPLCANEPVAYFLFDEKEELTIELSTFRKTRYILLMTTGIRQKTD